MAQSYTPGLKVVESMLVQKKRLLPIKGDVLVKEGDMVEADKIVAYTDLPGDVYPVNIVNMLGVGPKLVAESMLKPVGSMVEEGEIIARATSFFGLFKNEVKSPVTGTIENVSSITGQVILRGKPQPVQVQAYLPGKVCQLIPEEGVEVQCRASFIQGIFGIGGESLGKLVIAVKSPDEVLSEELISEDYKGKIVVGGSLVTAEALRKAEHVGVAGIIVGGFDDSDLKNYLGYDLGVAITGNEDIDITLIVTEGFGQIRMAESTFNLLKANQGKHVSINGATQIRAGVIRPEVVIPQNSSSNNEAKKAEEGGGLEIGSSIRCIRSPYFGKIGKVVNLPHELHKLESETMVRVLELEFPDGERAILPRANIEVIEQQ